MAAAAVEGHEQNAPTWLDCCRQGVSFMNRGGWRPLQSCFTPEVLESTLLGGTHNAALGCILPHAVPHPPARVAVQHHDCIPQVPPLCVLHRRPHTPALDHLQNRKPASCKMLSSLAQPLKLCCVPGCCAGGLSDIKECLFKTWYSAMYSAGGHMQTTMSFRGCNVLDGINPPC